MDCRSLLITGGAGFVGSNLAMLFRETHPDVTVIALDSLKRRGSELNLPRLREAGIVFHHGDVRCPEDLATLPDFDMLLDCSAEPSVQAGTTDSPRYVLNTNLTGTINCLELCRERQAALLFLSTSRVYPIRGLNTLAFTERETRYEWRAEEAVTGMSSAGIAEEFSLAGGRSFYGASKLASELLVTEYHAMTGMRTLINRCGVITGPWQMGKVDQGVVALWVARHHFQRSLQYTGFGGNGKQVRDLLHVRDLFELIVRQIGRPPLWDGRAYNVGGGPDISVSLRELTNVCVQVTGNRVPVSAQPETNPLDVRIYQTDAGKVRSDFDWRPQQSVEAIVGDVHDWICDHESELQPLLA